jgi:hypothetical protein
MISSYRLGDLVLMHLNKDELNDILKEHPNTLGAKFIQQRIFPMIVRRETRIDTITRLVLNEMKKYNFPKDIEQCNVVHLRLGDVVAGNEFHELDKRPLEIENLKSILPEGKTYVIGKCFFAKLSSTNYEECIEKSNEYLSMVLRELGAIHFDSGNADLDLLCAVKARCFIQGKGQYSRLIVEIRKRLGLRCL